MTELKKNDSADEPEPQRQGSLWLKKAYLQIRSYFAASDTKALIGLSLIIGVCTGVGAFIFRSMIDLFQSLFFEGGRQVFSFLGDYYIIIIPAIGGLIFGPLIYFFAREAKGHGVPEVMYAVARKNGRINPIVALIKALASSICIGSGGSVGREGPIVQIGSTLGSAIGRWFKVPSNLLRTLVAAGAAGGISATFNAPIAGVIFAMEIILREFTSQSFSIVVLSSVVAWVVGSSLMGDEIVFSVPPYALNHSGELLLYAFLGILAAVVARIYIRTIYTLEDTFDNWKIMPEYFKPVVGGFILGVIGLYILKNSDGQTIFGVGYGVVESALLGKLALKIMLVLLVAKLIATALTLGSGGSGGVFAPSLFIGAMLGGSFGLVAGHFFPTIAGPGAYALVGMAAVFAGATHAPMTAIIILFEMTRDYHIIMPVMISTVIAVIISHAINPETIYTLKLSRRGVKLSSGKTMGSLEGVTVAQVMSKEVEYVREHLALDGLTDVLEKSVHSGFPVTDSNEELVGLLTYAELHSVVTNDDLVPQLLVVKDVMREPSPIVFSDEPVSDVTPKFDAQQVDRFPVVHRDNPKKMVGIITQADVLNVYQKMLS